MPLALLATAVCYLGAALFARGWVVGQSFSWALALIALGLLAQLISGTAHAIIPRRPPAQSE